MCATVFQGVHVGAAAYDEQGEPVDICGERSRVLDRICAANVHPIAAHVGIGGQTGPGRTQNIPVCRRAASDIML